MIYLGIDIGKDFHVAGCITDESKVVIQPFKFKSKSDGYKMLKGRLESITTDRTQVKIGMEATGHYWINLYEQLAKDGFALTVLNPLQVHAFRNQGIRGNKTDSVDALLIAKMLHFGDYVDRKAKQDVLLSLRYLTRYRHDLIEQITSIKNKIICLLDIVFPEYERLFSNVFGSASLALLREASTPEQILKLDNKKLQSILTKNSHGRFGTKDVPRIKDTARDSFGSAIAADIFDFQIKLTISQIDHLTNQVKELDDKISFLYNRLNLPLTTIPGIGPTNAASIIAEIGNIANFKHPKGPATALVAFAGFDPRLSESGKYKGHAKMSKRGSKYLRKAVYQTSFIASQRDLMFKAIYDKQRSRGKAHQVALSHVANKMLHVIWSVLKNNKPYVLMMSNLN
ncbi:MAG: IS110 family transposase [Candidatus Omnitrophica bacterium]|nr:IS110 family transposase [Candidatus Omnitrophota bacterium]